MWVVWDALVSAAGIYLSVREAGSIFVECLSSDLGELERFFSSSFGICGSVIHRESQREDFLLKTHVIRLPSFVCQVNVRY